MIPAGPQNPADGVCYNITASPVVFRDRVIQCCDQARDGFILAVNSTTGQVLWKTPRNLRYQYGTPLLFEHRGTWQAVVGASTVTSYDPMTGTERWSCAGLTDCVAPSPIYGDDGLVYATSGRNGPSLAIDPGGVADVKETRVRMQVATGGPYVPSPLFRSMLILPADDGVLRLIEPGGTMTVAERLRAHFTASPVIGGSNLYWTAESGDTYVLDASRLAELRPTLRIVSINPLGEKCLASPAIAGGHLFVRTAQALYCLGGNGGETTTSVTRPATTNSFAELKQRFEAHRAADGDDIPVRLAVVNALSELQSTQAVVWLQQIALKDPHWDVCEAAAKALAASDTPASIPALLLLEDDRRDYMKVIAAQGLGRLRAVAAVPLLLQGITNAATQVRIARLQALSEIAPAPDANASLIQRALQSNLTDKEGTVRRAAILGLAELMKRPDFEQAEMIAVLESCTTDPNPLVATAARETLNLKR